MAAITTRYGRVVRSPVLYTPDTVPEDDDECCSDVEMGLVDDEQVFRVVKLMDGRPFSEEDVLACAYELELPFMDNEDAVEELLELVKADFEDCESVDMESDVDSKSDKSYAMGDALDSDESDLGDDSDSGIDEDETSL